MILFGTEICLKKPPRFVRIAIVLLAVYWAYALYVLGREIVTGSMGIGVGYHEPFRFFVHYVPQVFFIPWIELSIFRRIPLFRTIPGVGFIAIGLITVYQYTSYLIATLMDKQMVGLTSGDPMSLPPLYEILILLPLFLLVLVTGIMLIVGKKEKSWYL